ncbi:MAG: type II toxin-antitoxin system VapC family toxin [Egibacteraceae bacterium]
MLLVDAGPLSAAAATRDRNHERCAELLTRAMDRLVVPMLVLTEVAYLLGDRLGPKAEASFAWSLARGELPVEPLLPSDWERIAELTETYADFPLGIVDASVVATAERLGITQLATLDHRHFSAVRPRHVDAFTILP